MKQFGFYERKREEVKSTSFNTPSMKIKIRGHGWEEEIEAEETLDAIYVEKDNLCRLLKKAGKKTDLFETLVDGERVEEHLDR